MGLISLQMTQIDIKLRQLLFTERTQEEAHSSAHAQQQGLGRARLGPLEGIQGLQCHLEADALLFPAAPYFLFCTLTSFP